ncbi:MAG: nuclear transport factor 2 family protein [Chloroflexota bacterium]|nr:nuclear transport factor 2 family protein [Chloroflexota bacterium]
MTDAETRAELVRHWSDPADQEQIHEIYHDDVVLEFPQSGERLLGLANVRGMREAYPAKLTFTIQRMRNSGDLWVSELVLTYDGDAPVHAVNIMEFRDGKVTHETIFFGDPWVPPAWRAPWVEVPEPAPGA